MSYSQSQVALSGRASSQIDRITQRSAISAKNSNSYIEEDEDLAKKADECVQYILLCCLSERKAIVKRADLNKNVIKDASRQYKAIIKMVEYRLEEVFGIELVQIDETTEMDKSEKIGLRNKYEFDLELNISLKSKRMDANDGTDPVFIDQFKYSMLMVSLSLIFMNDNEIEANLFWDSMKKLGINRDEKKHKYLGDVTKYFTGDLVKEVIMYFFIIFILKLDFFLVKKKGKSLSKNLIFREINWKIIRYT